MALVPIWKFAIAPAAFNPGGEFQGRDTTTVAVDFFLNSIERVVTWNKPLEVPEYELLPSEPLEAIQVEEVCELMNRNVIVAFRDGVPQTCDDLRLLLSFYGVLYKYEVFYKNAELIVIPKGTAIAIATGVSFLFMPSFMDGWVVEKVSISTATAGSGGSSTFQIARERGASRDNLMNNAIELTTGTFVESTDVNDSFLTIATGDRFYIDILTTHSTPPQGLAFAIGVNRAVDLT